MIVLTAALAIGRGAGAAPLEVYGKLPRIEQAAVSPSGDFVAYIITDGEKRTVAVESVPERKPVYVSDVGAVKLRDLTWAGDQHLILTVSTTVQPMDVIGPRVEHALAFDLDLQSGRIKQLLNWVNRAELSMNTIYGVPQIRTIKGKPVVFVHGMHFIANQGQIGLFRVDLDSHIATLIEPGARGDSYDWVINQDGVAVAQASYDDDKAIWSLMVKGDAGRWRNAYTVDAPIETPDLIGIGRDGRSILVDVYDDKLGTGWRELTIESGVWGEPIAGTETKSAIQDPTDGHLIGTSSLVGDERAYSFFDPHDAAVWRAVKKAYAGDLVTLVSWSDNRKKIVVRVDSAELGPAYALVDLNTGDAAWLGPEYVGLKAGGVSPVKPIRYKAADGLEITGYLTLPAGRPARALPLVVMPHGGPAARDAPGFDWWAQALASRGYAVLQPNFRGSTGFGDEFYAAGFGEFGRKMQTDLSDGVRYLAGQGVIDPKRVCIVGASYGGYAALAGATLDRGVYRCAVDYAGPSDLRSLITDSKSKGGEDALRFWERYIGAKDLRDPVIDRVSPAAHAVDADIPILLIHGRDDTIVPIAQSRKMAAALRQAGKPVEFTELKGEDHWMSRGETRQQMLGLTVDFLERNNPPN
jgi:dipeptidyl aminopeptidase/acylaminoacyl peptidase